MHVAAKAHATPRSMVALVANDRPAIFELHVKLVNAASFTL